MVLILSSWRLYQVHESVLESNQILNYSKYKYIRSKKTHQNHVIDKHFKSSDFFGYKVRHLTMPETVSSRDLATMGYLNGQGKKKASLPIVNSAMI